MFKLVEALVNKSGQVRMPTPGADVANAGAQGLDAIKAAHAAKLPDGRFRKDVEPAYAAQVDKMYRDYFASQQAA